MLFNYLSPPCEQLPLWIKEQKITALSFEISESAVVNTVEETTTEHLNFGWVAINTTERNFAFPVVSNLRKTSTE